MGFYSAEYTLLAYDAEPYGVVRATSIQKYMQETASRQMYEQRPSYLELIAEGKAFIVNRIAVKNTAPLYAGQKIRVETWPCPGKGIVFPRCYRVTREGSVVAEGESLWACVNPESKKFWPVSEVDIRNFPLGELLGLEGVKFSFPPGLEMLPVGEHIVSLADIDSNLHMNNALYADMFCTFLPELAGKYVVSFSIHYAQEAPLGAKLSLSRSAGIPSPAGTAYYLTASAPHLIADARFVLGDR